MTRAAAAFGIGAVLVLAACAAPPPPPPPPPVPALAPPFPAPMIPSAPPPQYGVTPPLPGPRAGPSLRYSAYGKRYRATPVCTIKTKSTVSNSGVKRTTRYKVCR